VIRAAIIGRGMAGGIFHQPLISALPDFFSLKAVVGRTDANVLIADEDIDLIVIATPNDTHAELAEAALRAGKHVVIDKPFVLRAEDGEHLIDLAGREGRILTVFQNRRWDGDYLTVAELLASGALGEVRLFEAHWDRFRPSVPVGWREVPGPGAGTLWNLGPHMVGQMLQLFGVPRWVDADIGVQRDGAVVDDYFALTFGYGTLRVTLAASNIVAAARPRFAVHGTGGSFVKYQLDPQEERLAASESPLAVGFGEEPADRHGTLMVGKTSKRATTKAGDYLEFYRGVASAIRDDAEPPVDPAEALTGIRVLAAARKSSDLGSRLKMNEAGNLSDQSG